VKNFLRAILVLVVSGLSQQAFSVVAFVNNASIVQIITTESNYGGCMTKLSKPINTATYACPGEWVSFACTGVAGNSVPRAAQMWDTVLLAYALEKKVRIRVDSSIKLNGYCYADYIRVQD